MRCISGILFVVFLALPVHSEVSASCGPLPGHGHHFKHEFRDKKDKDGG